MISKSNLPSRTYVTLPLNKIIKTSIIFFLQTKNPSFEWVDILEYTTLTLYLVLVKILKYFNYLLLNNIFMITQL